ncbi:MAG TPA: enoyl-CoA hydratase-related protein [Anaerolineaceae bacterium]|nr:enoyl-CoA hydratase-related protein [Anaerolineaceae bacterium]
MTLVEYETAGQVGLITINRPESLNAINRAVLQELSEVLDAVDLETTRCLVITGAGERAFIAGADVAEMCCMTEPEARMFSETGNNLFRKIEAFPLPVIAAINGYALGGGNELALSCDIRICSENAVFGQPEAGLGITPGFGGTQRLARVIGSISKAKELLFTCRNIKAEEALQIGLVSCVFPQQDLLAEAQKIANRIAANAPIAIRNMKKAVNEGLDMPIVEAIQHEVSLFSNCFTTEDQKEGMQAFMEKRKEKAFKNR